MNEVDDLISGKQATVVIQIQFYITLDLILQAYSFRVKSSQAISHLEMELVSSI
jgi:hypothetical protein